MMVKKDEFNCTVMECKTIEGHGATIDCILVDGVLKKGNILLLYIFFYYNLKLLYINKYIFYNIGDTVTLLGF